MPKFMNSEYLFDLQLFTGDDGDGGNGDSGDGDDQDDDESDEDGDDVKFTQADIDKAVARTIAKERKKAERAKASEDKKKAGTSKKDDESDTADTEKTEAISKASKLEVKVACYEAGVAKDSVDDVTALAKAYMDADADLDLEEAIEKVVKKYPSFKTKQSSDDEGEDKGKSQSWGKRQTGKGSKKTSGVEAAFLKKNPGLKV
ncbi:MAG: hypothetical protein R3Y58_08635 [Eubacteriales bacterium]